MKNNFVSQLILKTIFLFLFSFCIIRFAYAQLKVDNFGDIEMVNLLNVDGYYNTTPRIYPITNNNGEIGISGKQFMYIRGQYHYATSNLLTSDKRLKENIKGIDNSLQKLIQLEGKKYDFIFDESKFKVTEKEKNKIQQKHKDQLGFLAQDVLSIIPEAVVYEEEEDRYYLNYDAFIPVLVEAIKELNDKVNTLKGDNAKQKSTFIGTDKPEILNNASLNQNIPNPFTENTVIGMHIPKNVSTATLYVYNMQGKQIDNYKILDRENTSITIDGFTLDAGMYLYTLIIDGTEVDTKKMVLTK